MNPDGGFTRSYRRLWSHPVFRSKQEAAVFAWMKDIAQWRDTRLSTRFGPVELHVGEALIAERELAADFGMHRNTLRSLLHRMVDDGMITLIRDRCPHRAGTIALIVNYKTYQGITDESGDSKSRKQIEGGTGGGPKGDRSGTKNNELKEWKEEKEEADAVPGTGDPAPRLPLGPRMVTVEAVQIIAAFRASREAAFGQNTQPLFPNHTDRIDAARWLKAAADAGMMPAEVVDLCADVFRATHARMASKNKRPPRALAFHDQDIADAVARRSQPLPEGHVASISGGASRPLTASEMRAQLRASMG